MSTIQKTDPQSISEYVMTPVRKMRNFRQRQFFVGLGISFIFSASCGLAYFYLYAKPKFLKYKAYLESQDAMQRWMEICENDPSIMHTCPETRAKRLAEL